MIRTLGILPANVPKDDDGTLVRRVNLDYTMAAVQAFRECCVNPFQFVYVSGAIVERDQNKPLWYMQDYRRLRVCCCLYSLRFQSPGMVDLRY